MNTRIIMAGIVGIVAWSLSIVFIPVKQVTSQNTENHCANGQAKHVLLEQVERGVLSNLYQDGETLWAHVTPRWEDLNPQAKDLLYDSLVCLAQVQGLSLNLKLIQIEKNTSFAGESVM